MDKKILTKEMIQEAEDYTPNAFKKAWCGETAPKCFDRLAITADGEPMPPMYMVNEGLKKRYLMTVFVKGYLKQECEPDSGDEALMSEADYDRWAGSHVFCQMERLKKDKDICDKCYDMLYDFRELDKRLSAQISGLLNAQNDFVQRQNQLMSAQFMQLPQVKEQLEEMIKRRKKDGAENDETPV